MLKLEVKKLTKTFGPVIANEEVDFGLERGEVHVVLGENGAGKTTLMNCIYGIMTPDSGQVIYEGDPIKHTTVTKTIKKGIGMVHQHFMLVHNMSALDNIMLGLKPEKGMFLDRRKTRSELNDLMEKYGITIPLDQEIQNMSVGSQQSVEILKALYRESSLLILDEPTSVLTPQETKDLFRFIREYVQKGNSVILITHKLEEILDASDRITVMRSGRIVGTYIRSDIRDKNELAAKMVGKDIELSVKNILKAPLNKKVVLKVRDYVVKDHRGVNAVDHVDLDLFEGEILGIAGVSGNGQKELAEALAGLRQNESGEMEVSGQKIEKHNSREMQKMDMRFIPEDRHKHGLVLKLSVKDNFLLSRYFEEPYSQKGKLNHSIIDQYVKDKIDEYNVKTPSMDVAVEKLSGGNQQKLILARELSSRPRILIAAQPTRGLDVSAAKFVQNQILQQKKAGTAILFISTALDEVMDMCDRVAVMYKGRIVGNFDVKEVSYSEIGALMAGSTGIHE